jgi:LPXTG-site transpeptidase (sortase) family protein
MIDFFRVVPKKRTVKIKSKKGIIFNNPSGWRRQLFHSGTIIFLFAISYSIYLYWPLANSFITYKIGKKGIAMESEIKKEMIEEKIVVEEFFIKIPKIAAEAEVKKNISPYDINEYLPILNNNVVAHSKTSSFPNEGSTVYLFAHSSQQSFLDARDNAVFYLLGELKNGDDILINYNGTIFTYRIYMEKIIKSKETDYLDYIDSSKEILILQTCWPIGTNWQRLLVFAERV